MRAGAGIRIRRTQGGPQKRLRIQMLRGAPFGARGKKRDELGLRDRSTDKGRRRNAAAGWDSGRYRCKLEGRGRKRIIRVMQAAAERAKRVRDVWGLDLRLAA